MDPLGFLNAIRDCVPTIAGAVGLMPQAIQPSGEAGEAMKATERVDLAESNVQWRKDLREGRSVQLVKWVLAENV